MSRAAVSYGEERPPAACTSSDRFRPAGTTHLSKAITVEQSTVQEVQLHGSFPNPARTQVTIRYALPRAADVRLKVYDLLGRRVRTVVNERQSAGRKQYRLDASRLGSGTYFYRLTAGETTETRKLTVVR